MKAPAFLAKLRQYPLAVVCVGIFIGMVVLAFLRGNQVELLSTTEQGLSSRLGVIKTNQMNTPGLAEEVEAVEARVEDFKKRLFDRDQRAINTDFFYNMEDSVDVRILEVSQTSANHSATMPGGPHELKQHDVIVFDLSVRGTFPEIVGYLQRLHQVDPFVRVSDLEIGGAGRGDAAIGAALSASLRVLVLARQPEKQS